MKYVPSFIPFSAQMFKILVNMIDVASTNGQNKIEWKNRKKLFRCKM